MRIRAVFILGLLSATSAFIPASSAVVVNQTTNSNDLSTALVGSGLTITSVTLANGIADQVGTYSGFDQGPVKFSDGVVLSDGNAEGVAGPPGSDNFPSTDVDVSGTSEFDAYGPGHITNFSSSNDVAALSVDFNLAEKSQIQFDTVFGSTEYPDYVNDFTDGFLAFLDGTDEANQIVFDKNGNAVQVGTSFTNELTTDDVNTAFGDQHGLITSLTTTSPELAAGDHNLLLEVGDTNDHVLDSAAFIANLRTGSGDIGTIGSGEDVPEPSSIMAMLFGLVLLGLVGAIRRLRLGQ